MKLARKLVGALVAAILLVMLGHAWLQIRRDEQLFETDTENDEVVVGRVVRTGAEAVWNTAGEGWARLFVADADAQAAHLRIRWVSLAPNPLLEERPAVWPLPEEQLRSLLGGEEVSLLWRDAEGEGRRATYVPLRAGQPAHGAIELSESLGEQTRHIRTSELQIVGTTIGIVALCGVLASFLGWWIVGRPVQALSEAARRIGAGDLRTRVGLTQRDEIGGLAREIDRMATLLRTGSERLAAETQARIEALEQLRHADRLRTVGQLASGVAHELGTPLNVVAGRAKMIATGRSTGDEVARGARVIGEQAERMTRIVRQLLDFSRRRGPVLAPCPAAALTSQTVEMLAPIARKAGVELVQGAGDATAALLADSAQIQQALTNLVLNAIQASAPGGRVTVRVERRRQAPPIDAGGGPPVERVAMVVEDQGAGIEAEALTRVFEPFFTTKDVGEGTGLGLSVAWGIVREHGGWIDVESEVGRGSRFAIVLPPAAGASGAAA